MGLDISVAHKLLFIGLVFYIHITFVNRLEKLFVQVSWGPKYWTRRPTKECMEKKRPIPSGCFGMPSGHAECVAVVFILLLLWNLIPFYIGVMAIILVGLHCLIWTRHTIIQLFIGILLGTLYACSYVTLWGMHPVLAWLMLFVLFGILIILGVMLISKYHHETPLPAWVHPTLYPIIERKLTKTSMLSKCINNIGYIYIDSEYYFVTWKDLENILDDMCASVDPIPDVVVGIKTGGAILAGYVARKLGRPLAFMRTKRSVYKCTENVQSITQTLSDVNNVESEKNEEYQVCEEVGIDVYRKHVLLIDETAYSGKTVQYAKEHLYKKGAVSVQTFIPSVVKKRDTYDYVYTRGIMAWPWSFDN